MTSRKYKIGELGKVVTGKTPSTGRPEYWSGEYPFITIPDLSDLPYVEYSSRTLSESGAAAIKSQLLPGNSVLMSCIATIGKCGITTKPSFTNQQINAVIPNAKVNPLFLLYLFRNLGAEMTKYGSGGTVYSNISKSLFESIEVEIPESLNTQLAIANVLASLDAKIAINKSLSKTLEEITQTLFKSWFIDFDPVKAKMAGERPAGMDAATAALFPDSIVDSEIGLIPKGWTSASIGDISNINGGKMLSREEFNPEGTFPIFGGAGVMGKTNKSNADGFVITVGRVGAYCGQFFYHRGSAWVNNNASRIIPKDDISGEWVYLFLKSFNIENIKKGAAQPFVSNSDLAKSKLMLPSVEVIQKFTEVVEPIFKQSENANNQARLLSKLRDSLLPRLISGELQIPDEMLAS
jgi:type I restriction enzyme, S subunit